MVIIVSYYGNGNGDQEEMRMTSSFIGKVGREEGAEGAGVLDW